MQQKQLKRLSELACGERGILQRLEVEAEVNCMRLLEMGMVIGSQVVMIGRGPLNGPVHFSVCGSELCLSKIAASWFWVSLQKKVTS
ncbi:MAG: FeoA family protein [bacterium]|nr:FeoA family protein [bacterium]